MDIEVDRDKCCGVGNCVEVAPSFFTLSDEDGHVVLLQAHASLDDAAAVREAAAQCPTDAIDVVE
jgi:ferredoxin